MGCVASKLEEDGVVVSICKERKRQLKLAVEKRHALAEAHCKYCQALCAVAAAINLFVSRYSSPPQSFLITFSPPSPPHPDSHSTIPQLTHENVITNPMFLQQRPSESTHEAIPCASCGSSSSTSSEYCEDERREEHQHQQKQQEEGAGERAVREEEGYGYFYMQMPPAMPSPQRDFGWDFFNPFDGVRPEIISGYRRSSEEDLRAVREEEGIPELEEEGERECEEQEKVVVVEEKRSAENGNVGEVVKVVDEGNVSQGESKGLSVMDASPVEGRELLEAMKDIVDLFMRACESAKDVSKMLEANKVQLQSGLEEIKENSTKLIQAISWHSTGSSKASSCKSLVVSSSKSSTTWIENDLFDDYGGMDSGSHSLTLGRLYAWEKKLYEEVKAGDMTRKLYEKKCSRLKHQDVRGDDELSTDKTRAAVKDLYARILVAIRSAESISKRIQVLRDEELQPQIVELLKGLMRTWKIMLDCHETQNMILVQVKSFAGSTFGKFCNNSHRRATLQLEVELLNWQACFSEYVTAQKAYVEALHGWLTKFMAPEEEFYSRGRSSAVPYGANGPPLFVICRDWLSSMEKLPDRAVTIALKCFAKDVRALLTQQGEEQKQKRKVDSLAKELDQRIVAFQKTESRLLEPKLTEHKSESDREHQSDYLTDKKDQLDMFKRKLDVEREKHQNYMKETQLITLNGFQTGFCAVFEALRDFSAGSQKMYSDLVTYNESVDKVGNPSFIEGTKVEENGSR